MARLLSLLLFATAATPQIYIATRVETFHWTNPFQTSSPPPGFEAACTAARTFPATQHMVQDLGEEPPLGLAPWADAVKFFFGGRPFPGSWEGIDHKGAAREIVKMRWADVPGKVRAWIRERQGADKENDERYLFAVYEGAEGGERVKEIKKLDDGGGEEGLVVLFAAGALYEILPLWVAEGSDCEDELSNLENYVDAPEDGKVVAWPTERTNPDVEGGSPDIEFTIKAQVLRETEAGREARLKREEEKRAKEGERRREEAEEEARLREEDARPKEGEDGKSGDGGQRAEQGEGRGEATHEEGPDETTLQPPTASATGDEKDKDEL